MFAGLKRWFCAKQKQADKEPAIAAGELWQLVPAADPWGPKSYRPVRILDVRDGWVRYDMGGLAFRDERHPVKTFVRMYRRVDA
jgi:hypothetical protein